MMTYRIQWAAFGGQEGGHFLLGASGNKELAGKLAQFTDRPGDPPLGLKWGPADSGFRFHDHYVFLRCLPDSTVGRAGMVRTYAAFIPVDQLFQVDNILEIFSRFPAGAVDLPAELQPWDIELGTMPDRDPSIPGLVAITQRIGDHEEARPIVWIEREPLLPALAVLWSVIDPELREKFAFSFQFAPEHKLPVTPFVISTIAELSSRWDKTLLCQTNPGGLSELPRAQRWIVGVSEEPCFLGTLKKFDLKIRDFSELRLLSDFVDLLSKGVNSLTFRETCRAIRILERCATCDSPESEGRRLLFDHICVLVSVAKPDEVASIRNFKEAPLWGLIPMLSDELYRWIGKQSYDEDLFRVIGYIDSYGSGWWSKPFLIWLKDICLIRTSGSAKLCFELIKRGILLEKVSNLIDDGTTAELNMIEVIPDVLTDSVAKELVEIADRRGWIKMNAAAHVRLLPPDEAIRRHAAAAGASFEGFDLICDFIGFEAFLLNALDMDVDNINLYLFDRFRGSYRKLSPEIARNGKSWPLLISKSLEKTSGLVDDYLRKFVIVVIQRDPDGLSNPGVLYRKISRCDSSLWLEIPQFEVFLEKIDRKDREVVVTAIRGDLSLRIMDGRISKRDLPKMMPWFVPEEEVLKILCSVPSENMVAIGVNAFLTLDYLGDVAFRAWLIDLFTKTHPAGISKKSADEISRVFLERDFLAAAEVVKDTVSDYNRKDVAPIFGKIRYKYHMNNQSNKKSSNKGVKRRRPIKIVIATALPLERREVMAKLPVARFDPNLLADIVTWVTDEATFEVYVLATGQGNLDSYGNSLQLMQRVKPKGAFFVGVGGGVKDSDLGDVVYSTKIHYYEGGKEDESGVLSRPSSEMSSKQLVQLAMRVAEDAWQGNTNVSDGRVPAATPAIIASGEKVLTGRRSKALTFQRIKSSFNDTQVVEMEGYGFLKACRECGIKHAIVIRGVSDKVKGKSEADGKGGQPVAAMNAVRFLFELLSRCSPVLIKRR